MGCYRVVNRAVDCIDGGRCSSCRAAGLLDAIGWMQLMDAVYYTAVLDAADGDFRKSTYFACGKCSQPKPKSMLLAGLRLGRQSGLWLWLGLPPPPYAVGVMVMHAWHIYAMARLTIDVSKQSCPSRVFALSAKRMVMCLIRA